jgi:hypothetical protein
MEAPEQLPNLFMIVDVSLNKRIPATRPKRIQVVSVSGIGQLVQIHNLSFFGRNPIVNEIGPNEPGASGDKNAIMHAVVLEILSGPPGEACHHSRWFGVPESRLCFMLYAALT